jgi:hypothetical protein
LQQEKDMKTNVKANIINCDYFFYLFCWSSETFSEPFEPSTRTYMFLLNAALTIACYISCVFIMLLLFTDYQMHVTYGS